MLQTTISDVEALRADVWKSGLSPEMLMSLGRPQSEDAGPSVLFLPDATFSERDNTLSFPHGKARVINLGTSDYTIIARVEAKAKNGDSRQVRLDKSGDRALLREAEMAGPKVCQLVEGLLEAVRKSDPQGEFMQYPQRKFINRPDNFVTIIPQPRVLDVRVIIRGSPSEFRDHSLKITRDQNGYSTFKVSNPDELANGIAVLSSVRRKKEGR